MSRRDYGQYKFSDLSVLLQSRPCQRRTIRPRKRPFVAMARSNKCGVGSISVFRLVPHPVCRRFVRIFRFRFERLREVVGSGMTVGEENGRDEPLIVGLQFGLGHVVPTARVVPMNVEILVLL